MTDYRLVPVEQIRRALYALEKFANDTLTGRNAADELRELLSAEPAVSAGGCIANGASVMCNGDVVATAHGLTLAPYRAALIAECLNACAGFKRAPCHLCGYNGPGYYQPDTHPCAAKY